MQTNETERVEEDLRADYHSSRPPYLLESTQVPAQDSSGGLLSKLLARAAIREEGVSRKDEPW